jgi:hypothetical protein
MVRPAVRWSVVRGARIVRRLGPRTVVLLAVFALLAPSLARVAGPDGPAWFPTHGHIFLSAEAATHPHQHPWDHDIDSEPKTPVAAPGDVLFTFGDLDVASALAMIALPACALLLAVAWCSSVVVVTPGIPRGTLFRPLVPPPQS